MVIRDPQFWKRFSVAVHQDDAAKKEMTERPDLKHSYVTSPSRLAHSSPPVGSPIKQTFLSYSLPPLALLSPVAWDTPSSPALSPPAPGPWELPSRPTSLRPKRKPSKLQKSPSTKPLLRPVIRPPPAAFTSTSDPLRSSNIPLPVPSRPWTASTLSLSGRPHGSFRFWTTITADPSHRDSWLAGQQRKSRQRAWICWIFWLCLITVVAGVVVAIVVLKAHGIL